MKLEVGYKHSPEVRRKNINPNFKEQLGIIYLSDFHFNGFSAFIVDELIHKINLLNPSIILLGGDYIDTIGGLSHLAGLLSAITANRLVFAIAGNHDRFWGLNRIKKIMADYQVKWLEKSSAIVRLGNAGIQIDGNHPVKRDNDIDLHILFTHKPVNYHLHKNNYHLILSGHLHGSQFVFWQTSEGLYPGRLFYRWNILEVVSHNCHYLVSKGLGDTLPIRYNCKRDIIFVTMGGNQPKQL